MKGTHLETTFLNYFEQVQEKIEMYISEHAISSDIKHGLLYHYIKQFGFLRESLTSLNIQYYTLPPPLSPHFSIFLSLYFMSSQQHPPLPDPPVSCLHQASYNEPLPIFNTLGNPLKCTHWWSHVFHLWVIYWHSREKHMLSYTECLIIYYNFLLTKN